MKKNLFFLIFGFSSLITKVQAQDETAAPSRQSSPIITLAANLKGLDIVDFSSLNLSDYPNTTEFDFSRMTPLSKLQDALASPWSVPADLPPSIIEIDGQVCSIEGTVTLISIKDQEIVLGSNYQTKRVEFQEDYTLSMDENVLATYTNHYYSYFDGTHLVFEVFTKQQKLGADLDQLYEGISFNIEDQNQQQDIHLVLNPNPAHNVQTIQANFDLWMNGNVTIRISDQLSKYNRVVFNGDLHSGFNTNTISIRDYPAGNYVVSVLFQGQLFSSNLIIQ